MKSRRAFGYHTLAEYPMVQDELLGMRIRVEAGALLAFEAALAFDAAIADTKGGIWPRLVTSLAKYLTAEDAIRASRAALELVGGNGYTSDYPIARIYRDAQVLTVWEGSANIQALESLRVLTQKYAATLNMSAAFVASSTAFRLPCRPCGVPWIHGLRATLPQLRS